MPLETKNTYCTWLRARRADKQMRRNLPNRAITSDQSYHRVFKRTSVLVLIFSFPTSVLFQFLQNPGRAHWEVAKRVIRYLKGTREFTFQLTDPEASEVRRDGRTHLDLRGSVGYIWGYPEINVGKSISYLCMLSLHFVR